MRTSSRFEKVRKDVELGVIRKDILTGSAKGGKEKNKSYAVALAGIEMTGSFNKQEVKKFQKRVLDLMQQVKVFSDRIIVGSNRYEKPLIEVRPDVEKSDSQFSACLLKEHVLCVEYRVFIRSVRQFLDKKFGSKFKNQEEVDKEINKIRTGLLFAVGGVWNIKDSSWLIRPSIGETEFWK